MDVAARSLPRRLHAITGLVPVGVFLVFHLAVNASATRGADAYNETARRLQELPLAAVLEIVLIAAPILYHGLYGLFLTASRPTGEPDAAPSRRRIAIFQRATGVPLFAFILFHLWTTRLVQVRDHGDLDLFHWMQGLYATPWIRVAYVVGLFAATSHFSAGLCMSAEDWGLSRSRATRISVAVVASAIFVALFSTGLRSLAAFRL